MSEVILFFGSNADTMIATKTLKDAGVVAKMIPRPADVSSPANLCLTLDSGFEVRAKGALARAGVALGGIVRNGDG